MRTKRFVPLCLVLGLAGIVCTPAAVAWGPNASRAISLCALQVVQQDTNRALEGRESDLVAGASISDTAMSRYGVQIGEVEPFESVIAQIALLRQATSEPYGMSKVAVARLNRALSRLSVDSQ